MAAIPQRVPEMPSQAKQYSKGLGKEAKRARRHQGPGVKGPRGSGAQGQGFEQMSGAQATPGARVSP